MKKIRFGLLYFACLFLLSACSLRLSADITPPPDYQNPNIQEPAVVDTVSSFLPADVENGSTIYQEKCVDCHGPTGLGDGAKSGDLPVSAAPIGSFDFAQTKTQADWFDIVTNGNIEKYMPGFQSLSDQERWDVTGYALTLSMDIQLDTVQPIFESNCSNCHSPGNASAIPDFLDSSQLADQSITQISAVIREGNSAGMPPFSSRFDENTQNQLAEYVRLLGYRNIQAINTEHANLPLNPTATVSATEAVGNNSVFTLTGNLVNLQEVPPDLIVTLTISEMSGVISQEDVVVDQDGTYRFPDLEMAAGRVYQLAATINGVEYTSEVLHSPEVDANGEVSLLLPITSTTTDASQIYAERMHVFFDFLGENTIQVVELYVIDNPGNNTVVPLSDTQPIIQYHLPAGAQNLQFEQGTIGSRFIETSDGFGDLQPIEANSSSQFLFAYEVPYQKELALTFQLPMPVQAAVFMLPVNGVEIKSDQLMFDGNRSVQGMDILTYSASNLTDQNAVELTLSGKIKITNPSTENSNLSLIIGAIVFIGALGLAIFWLFGRRKRLAAGNSLEEPADLDSLLDAVITLDDAYKNGDIPEAAYHSRRNELIAEIEQIQKKVE